MSVSKRWQKVNIWVNCSFKKNHFELKCNKWSGDSTEEHLLSQPPLSSLTRQTHFSSSNKTALVDHQLSCISQNRAGYLLGILSWANTYFYIHDPHVRSSKFDKIGFFSPRAVCYLFGNQFIYLFIVSLNRQITAPRWKQKCIPASLPKKSGDQTQLELRIDRLPASAMPAWFHWGTASLLERK